jgi:hypothetical protein
MRSLSLLRATTRLPSPRLAIPSLTRLARPVTTTASRQAYKDDQDRNSLKPRAHDGTSSSSDESAAHSEHAFDRTNTDPAKSKEENPEDLEVSGANQEINKPQGDNPSSDKGATRSERTSRSGSGGGAAKKAGKPT